jgi:hypothetical protein
MAGGGERRTNAVKGTASCKAKKLLPCDVETLKVTVTDCLAKSHSFSTNRRLIREPVPADVPAHAASALRSADFYIEVLGSSGGPGVADKLASVTAQATYVGACDTPNHKKPILISPEAPLVQPISGLVMLRGPADSYAHQDARSVMTGDKQLYSVVAASCGRPMSLAHLPRRSLNARIAVFTPQDWSITFSAPAGISVGGSAERGYKSSSSIDRKTFGSTVFEDSTSRDRFGKTSSTSGRLGDDYYEQVRTEVDQSAEGQKGVSTRTHSIDSFFSRDEISRKIEQKPEGGHSRGPWKYERSHSARGIKLDILRNGESVADTASIVEDVEMVTAAFKDFTDVLKGLPKAGYWIEGSAKFLAGSATYSWKRKPAVHVGSRHVCIGSAWKVHLNLKLVDASLEVGAGLKMQALSSFYGEGAVLFAYLSGTFTLMLEADIQASGEKEPESSPPVAPATGKMGFKAKVHGKASVFGAGWEYQRTASIEGKLEATPKMIPQGVQVTMKTTPGQWLFKANAYNDRLGRMEEYEISDLWALRNSRISEKDIADRDAKAAIANPPRIRTLIFSANAPHLRAS